jgi:small ligand-binding sensory domain FIST
VGVSTTGREHFEQPVLAVLLAPLPSEAFRVFGALQADSELQSFCTLCTEWRQGQDVRFAVVHGDPTQPQIAQLVARLGQSLEGFLVGGLGSSRGTQVQIADVPVRGGLSGVLLSSCVPVATGLTQGCSPIGPVHEITDCDRNILAEIDGRPALDVFSEDIGEVLARDLHRVAGYIFVGFPIERSDTGDYLVRNLLAIDVRRKWLAIGEHLHPGQPLVFCRRDAASAEQDLLRMLGNLKGRVGGVPKAGLYFSCLGRGPEIFGPDGELGRVRDVMGDFPLVGFFANGEIFHDRVYGYTGVLTLFL